MDFSSQQMDSNFKLKNRYHMHAKASAEPADVVWGYYCQVKQYKIEREVKQVNSKTNHTHIVKNNNQ
jgi:hypothetical protein